ncbi:MAG: alpha-glucosidase [Clostridia bacterium]|nr:alpha-glucosidase [Clostridia bacterium]
MPDRTRPDWWKSAVIYQIYPKSFADTTGSGQGDLAGITAHLDYIRDLGADLIWLSPVYLSPQKDNGYDVADFRTIDPRYGTMEDFRRLVRSAGDRSMGIVMDMVLNHTSSVHPWFQDALTGGEHRDFYIWSDTDDGSVSVFGDPAWTWSPEAGRYYYGSFSPHQPDLNWQNRRVRQAVFAAMRFWLEAGVAGFRLDAVPYISKDLACGRRCQGPDLHAYLREMRSALGPEVVLLGEDTEADLEDALIYTEPGGSELNMIFEFGIEDYDRRGGDKWHTKPLDLPGLKAHLARWQEGLEGRGWMTLFLTNHDMPRIVSRWGNEGRWHTQSATMLATAAYLLRGTPVIYQGEELGMTNTKMPLGAYDDLESVNYIRAQKKAGADPDQIAAALYGSSRDNARTPMQWTPGPAAGFTTGQPWLPVNKNAEWINVQSEEEDPASVLHYYRRLLTLRRRPVFTDGHFELEAAEDPHVFAYVRSLGSERIRIECNFSGSPKPSPFGEDQGRLLLGNYEGSSDLLRPYEARVISLTQAG